MNALRPFPQTHSVGELRRYLLYERLGVVENPFGVTPNPKYLYESRTHREARSSLIVGLECGVGFQTLIATPGMGKTTILLHVLRRFQSIAQTAFLFQLQGDSRDFLNHLLSELTGKQASMDVCATQEAINHSLLQQFRAGRTVILVVDEAQNLSTEVLETIRLLSNFETASEKLLQIILAGQPQLADKLASPELTQLRQRISLSTTLSPFGLEDTNKYIAHRLNVAGYSGPGLFTPDAIEAMWKESQGIPRNINMLCFNALLLTESPEARIDAAKIAETIADRSLTVHSLDVGLHPGVDRLAAREESASGTLPFVSDCETLLSTDGGQVQQPVEELEPTLVPDVAASESQPVIPHEQQINTSVTVPQQDREQKTQNTPVSEEFVQPPQTVAVPVAHSRRERWTRPLGLVVACSLTALLLVAAITEHAASSNARKTAISARTPQPVPSARQLSSPEPLTALPSWPDDNKGSPAEITAIQHSSTASSTTVSVLLGHAVKYEGFRLTSPLRIYFDLQNTALSPAVMGKPMPVRELAVSRIRVAEHKGNMTRIALVTNGVCNYTERLASHPTRLVIELRPTSATQETSQSTTPPTAQPAVPTAEMRPH